ncbi:MAG: hypothetical protein U1E66_08195 [Rhodospirillales bacterium]
MLNTLTFEKAEEVIRLAEQARLAPQGRADDPQRGGAGDDDGLTRPSTPPEPQPAATWAQAFELFLHDLSDDALRELIALYRAAGLEAGTGMSHAEMVGYLCGRDDLVERLRAALARLQ